MRTWVLLVLFVLASGLGACRGGSAGHVNHQVWTRPAPHPLLAAGAATRTSYRPNICPCLPDTHVVRRDGAFAKTLPELRAVLKPIETEAQAQAYREFLSDVQLERDATLTALQQSTPLDFREEAQPWTASYAAVHATRWGIGRDVEVTRDGDAFVLTGPQFRHGIDLDGETVRTETPVVELVRETIHRDGRYERVVLRVLAEGSDALDHQPAPIF